MKYIFYVWIVLIAATAHAQNHYGDSLPHQQNKKAGANDQQTQLHIPSSLKTEHEELHKRLQKATRLAGKTGTAAKEVATLLHPHFVKEEEYALPLLGLLPALAGDKAPANRQQAITLSDKLKKQLPQMLNEHQQVVAALQRLKQAATEEKHPDVVQFTEDLRLHAKTEEEVLYPTAQLIGAYLKLKQ